ncbi:MAG TPA: cytochrome b/b6 domain-containing protein [Bacteroidota bacterium]|nr:cytochrome b/b6 domain-containing protein [Bacteroidota bacterium]
MNRGKREFQHPFLVRATHWVNVIALGIMLTSGLRIYNASPIWNFTIPDSLTLGGWLAGARMWHFFGMWLFALNGAAWFVYNLLTRHGRQTTFFRRKDVPGVLPMILYYLRIRKEHPPAGKYNPLQKLAYTTIPLAALGSVLSGMSLYWPVQFGWLARLFGGYDTARIWHFVCAGGLVLFFAGHLLMVVIAGWANFLSIITGWKRVTD